MTMNRSDTQIARDIRARLAQDGGHVHLMGVCGVGMAGLAFLLASRGFRVSGCDVHLPAPLETWLSAAGVGLCEGHDAKHLDQDVDWVIRSTAVSNASDEVQDAVARGIPVFRRGDVLPVLLEDQLSVAVTGTHGKTTTSALIAQILRHAGRLDCWCIGGEVPALGAVAGCVGTPSGAWVVEADESDGSAAGYFPRLGVVTNVEFDHMEHFDNVDAFQDCFRSFIANTAGPVIYGADDPGAVALTAGLESAIGFGFSDAADVQCGGMENDASGVAFWVRCGEGDRSGVRLPFQGRHNVLNATAAFAACHSLGVTLATIVEALFSATSPRRRLETLIETKGVRVVSDYAHHPSEIRCAVSTLRQSWPGRIVAVFQPHRYTRTLALGANFPPAFAGVDELVLAPVYAASEAPMPGGCESDLYAEFRVAATSNEAIPVPLLVGSLEEAWQSVARTLKAGDLFVVLGAGDVETLAQRARDALSEGALLGPQPYVEAAAALDLSSDSRVSINEPMSSKTTLGVGGAADVWVSLDSVDDFQRTLNWAHTRDIPLTLVGGGSNLLVSDAGLDGVVCRLEGEVFHGIRMEDEATCVVGAAVTLAEMLDWMAERHLTGFEFVQGIPGTLGGGMHMNAGAWRQSLGDHVLWVRGLDPQGREQVVDRERLQLGYRHCGYLENHYVIEAAFRVATGDPERIEAEREAIRKKRAWMSGYRSAGSAFKNPVDEHAGRLLEKAGMRGKRIGGAAVFEGHGNFITASEGASASDVRALIGLGRMAVSDAFGVHLETEVRVIHSGRVLA